jgi:hypothetical protein
MVLAGQLENAEQLKRMNRLTEKQETESNYQEMEDSFEAARARLLVEQSADAERLRVEQDYRYKSFLTDEALAIEVCQKRIAATKANLEDDADIGRFLAKKFKKPPDRVLPLSVLATTDDLPRLLTGKGVARTQGKSSGGFEMSDTGPLQLPPLKMKPIRQRKITYDRPK